MFQALRIFSEKWRSPVLLFRLQRQSSEQSSYALYVSLPQSKFGRSMLAVRKAYSERSLHVSVHRKTGDFWPAQARLYWNRTALSNQRWQQHAAIQNQELSHQHQGVTLALWWSGGGVTLDWQRERNNRTREYCRKRTIKQTQKFSYATGITQCVTPVAFFSINIFTICHRKIRELTIYLWQWIGIG